MQIPTPFLSALGCEQREGALPFSAFPKASLFHLLDLLLDFYEKLILFENELLIFGAPLKVMGDTVAWGAVETVSS